MSSPTSSLSDEHDYFLEFRYFPWEFYYVPVAWAQDMTRNVDAIWVPTKFVMDGLISSGVPAEKITVVPHGVDYELFAHTRDGTHRLDVSPLTMT